MSNPTREGRHTHTHLCSSHFRAWLEHLTNTIELSAYSESLWFPQGPQDKRELQCRESDVGVFLCVLWGIKSIALWLLIDNWSSVGLFMHTHNPPGRMGIRRCRQQIRRRWGRGRRRKRRGRRQVRDDVNDRDKIEIKSRRTENANEKTWNESGQFNRERKKLLCSVFRVVVSHAFKCNLCHKSSFTALKKWETLLYIR